MYIADSCINGSDSRSAVVMTILVRNRIDGHSKLIP